MRVMVLFATVFALLLARAEKSTSFSVEGEGRYRLCFAASEDARYELRFVDADGFVRIGGIRPACAKMFPSEKKGEFVQEFYAPHFARVVRVVTTAGVMNVLRLTPVSDAEYLNINPQFDLAPGNYSGFSRNVQALLTNYEGRACLRIDRGRQDRVITDAIPVREGRTYFVRIGQIVSLSNGVDMKARAIFRDRWGRRVFDADYDWQVGVIGYRLHADRPDAWQPIVAPTNAVTMEFRVTTGALTGFWVQKEKDLPGALPPESPSLGKSAYDEIIVPQSCGAEARFAALELQKWIQRIADKELPVYHEKGRPGARRIEFKLDAKVVGALVAGTKGGGILVRADAEEGFVTGVFQLFERNTDLVFPRPHFPGEAIYTKVPNLRFPRVDFAVRPAYRRRELFIGWDYKTSLWRRRNYINECGIGDDDLFVEKSLCYEIGLLVSNEKYFKAHPEYFALKGGVRTRYGMWGPQVCYSSEGCRKALVREMTARMEKDLTPDIAEVHFAFADSSDMCQCADCLKPIRLEDGRVIDPDDERFRSTQYFRYINACVAELSTRFPRITFVSLGYIQAARPPYIAPHPRLRVIFCPYPKDDRRGIEFGDFNKQWVRHSRNWAKFDMSKFGIYEYWGDAMDFPRAVADAAAFNLKYWNGFGIHESIYSEGPLDGPMRIDQGSEKWGGAAAWSASAPEFWALARLFVDPTMDPQKLREDYLMRTYGKVGGRAMSDLYRLVQDEWKAFPDVSMYCENSASSFQELVRKKGRVDTCLALMAKAEGAANDPRVKDLVRKTRAVFESHHARARKRWPDLGEIPTLAKSADTRGMRLFVKEGMLVVRQVCTNDTALSTSFKKGVDEAGYPLGDRVEVMVGVKDSHEYYHFVVASDGKSYQAKGYDYTWKCDWSAKAKKGKGVWGATLSIPLAALGLDKPEERRVGLLILRENGMPKDPRRHDPLKFGGYFIKGTINGRSSGECQPQTTQERRRGSRWDRAPAGGS